MHVGSLGHKYKDKYNSQFIAISWKSTNKGYEKRYMEPNVKIYYKNKYYFSIKLFFNFYLFRLYGYRTLMCQFMSVILMAKTVLQK